MIEKLESERIDEALEYFDDHWSPDMPSRIRSILERFELSEDAEAVSEMIRIDIERRYAEGLSTRLDPYLNEFPLLADHPQRIAEIAFEDYRSRKVQGLPLPTSRYRDVPGVESLEWYQRLREMGCCESSAESRQGVWRQALAHADTIPYSGASFDCNVDSASSESRHGDSGSEPTELLDDELRRELAGHGFAVVARIGSGAFGKVYLATQRDLSDRYVVLKVVERTLAEPQKLALLQHTNIVPIYSFHPLGGRSVICMPYAGNVTLADFLSGHQQPVARGGESLIATVHSHLSQTVASRRGDSDVRLGDRDRDTQAVASARLQERPAAEEAAVLGPLEQLRRLDGLRLAVWLFGRLAAGLAHSHARGVLHGDLKPANVLIRNDGEPALLDFNLSRPLDRPGDQRVGGTLPYMSPEGYRELIGAPGIPSPASDIYGLGVMLFEYVTGRLPYPAPRSPAPIDLELAIDQRHSPPAWRADDQVTPSLRSVIDKCLAFEPGDRYLTAEDLKQDLDCEQEHRSLVHAREPVRSRCVKWIQRHPRWTSAGSVSALLLALLLPTAWAAANWRWETLALSSEAQLSDVTRQSEEALSTLIVDPMRSEEENIEAALQPLRTAGLLEPSSARRFVTAKQLEEPSRSQAHGLLLRHLGHVAWVEVDRLRSSKGSDQSSKPGTLQRLDELCDILTAVVPEGSSRAVMLLEAERAEWGGQTQVAETLRDRAAEMPIHDASEIYLEAVRLQTERSFAEARSLLASLADRNTVPSAIRWTLLGRVQIAEGDYEGAKLSFTQSLERAPQASRLWHLRAYCHRNLRQYQQAYADYSTALTLEPSFASAWWGRAQVLIQLGRREEALDDLNHGLVHRPDDAVLLMVRSNLLRQLGRDQAADADFARATEQTGLTSKQLYGRGIIRLQHDPEGALDDLQASLKGQQNSPRVHYRLARVLTRLNRVEEAVDSLARVVELEPENEKAWIDRAVLLARLGRKEEALEAYQRAIEPPTSAATLYQAACVNALLGDPKRVGTALSQLAKAIRGGFGMQTLASDPDLDSLRGRPAFNALQQTVYLASMGQPQLPTIEITREDPDPDPIDAPFP